MKIALTQVGAILLNRGIIMLRRYYKSLISMQFAVSQTLNAVIVFLFAFLTFRTGNQIFRYLGIAFGIVLAAQILFVQFRKQQVASQLNQVKKAEVYYNDGAMLGKSFVLEEKMLICTEKLKIQEYPTTGYSKMTVHSVPKDKEEITLEGENTITFQVDNQTQSERLAAFLKRKNPSLEMTGVIPDGDGSLNQLIA